MSLQFNYTTTSMLSNLYVTRKLNNMDKARMIKEERNNWTKIYYKILKELEVMIDMQKQVKDMVKMSGEINTIVTEIKKIILEAIINNQIKNTTNIAEISEDLQYIIQSNMEEQVFQIQRILANELDRYKGQGNTYVNKNI